MVEPSPTVRIGKWAIRKAAVRGQSQESGYLQAESRIDTVMDDFDGSSKQEKSPGSGYSQVDSLKDGGTDGLDGATKQMTSQDDAKDEVPLPEKLADMISPNVRSGESQETQQLMSQTEAQSAVQLSEKRGKWSVVKKNTVTDEGETVIRKPPTQNQDNKTNLEAQYDGGKQNQNKIQTQNQNDTETQNQNPFEAQKQNDTETQNQNQFETYNHNDNETQNQQRNTSREGVLREVILGQEQFDLLMRDPAHVANVLNKLCGVQIYLKVMFVCVYIYIYIYII
jgi:hypothetical protein